ncbi:16S rRNA (cytidine(1402)-2'-O)-methyltransferase [Deltaproteobacteria bacterium TL4]
MSITFGKLFIVSIPIGNFGDMTHRAIETLGQVELVVCEEYKEGARLRKQLNLKCSLESLNEHNEQAQIPKIIHQLKQGHSVALVSDCGTPIFADPGTLLTQTCVDAGITIVPIPGASSLMAALVCSAFSLKNFYYAGFLPRTTEDRRAKLTELKQIPTVLIIYEAPYRLLPLLKDTAAVMGGQTLAVICTQLTLPDEQVYRGTLKQLLTTFETQPKKCEFVLLVDNSPAVLNFRMSRTNTQKHAKKVK